MSKTTVILEDDTKYCLDVASTIARKTRDKFLKELIIEKYPVIVKLLEKRKKG